MAFKHFIVLQLFGTVSGLTIVPFRDFLADVQSSTYAGVMSRNLGGIKVRDEEAFNEMRKHILSHYEGVNVTRSFVAEHHFDCVTIESQPSLRGRKLAAPPPSMQRATSPTAQPMQDIFCELGTVPMKRISLERIVRFPSLAHFFAKSPHGPGHGLRSSVSNDIPHKYAHAFQDVDNIGGSSKIGLWNPQGDFTLSQSWYVAYFNGTVQSAECGNVRYDPSWLNASLFVYGTNNGYAENSGCYNLECSAFVQTNNNYTLGHKWSQYSTDGNVVALEFGYVLFKGNWWFRLAGENIGYYPRDHYSSVDGTAMAKGATSVDFGGEVTKTADGDNWPQMGSGKFADAGCSHAAGHYNAVWYSDDGTGTGGYNENAATLTPDAEDTSCYTINNKENDPNYGTWFLYGGPGGGPDGCTSTRKDDLLVV